MTDLKHRLKLMEFIEIEIPLVHPFRTSFSTETKKECIIVKITDVEDNVGWGETSVTSNPGYCYETLTTAWHIQTDFLFPLIKKYVNSETEFNIADLINRWYGVRGHDFAKAGIESALWSLKAAQEKKSLGELYHATKTEIPTGVSIGIQNSQQGLIDRIGYFLDQGYHRIKIKIEPGWDYDILKSIRDKYGDIQLMVDANSSYTLSDKHKNVLKSLDRFELTMIEQPLAYNDILQHKQLQAMLDTPICLDESIHNPEDAKLALEFQCCEIINIKPGRVGGYLNALTIAEDAGEGKVWCGGMLETGIGRVHNLFLQANSNFTIPGDTSGSDRYFENDIIEPAIEVNPNGYVTIPKGASLGVKVLENRVIDYSRKVIAIKL